MRVFPVGEHALDVAVSRHHHASARFNSKAAE
jgi:hypothetical protein